MYEPGTVVLIPFPFTDLSSSKVRPAVILSRYEKTEQDITVAFLSSVFRKPIKAAQVLISQSEKGFEETGLRVNSLLRCDKLATLSKKTCLGELGKMSPAMMKKAQKALKHYLHIT